MVAPPTPNTVSIVPHRYSIWSPRLLWIGAVTAVLVWVAVVILTIVAIFSMSFAFGPVNDEFTDLSGEEGSQRFFWPAGIDAPEAQKGSRKFPSTMDTHSLWYPIALAPAAPAGFR